MGDANDAEAVQLELRVPLAVALERGSRAVELVAVELHDELLLDPRGVDLVAAHDHVGRRHRNPPGAAEVEEEDLQVRARNRRLPVYVRERGAKRLYAMVPAVPLGGRLECSEVEHAEPFSGLDVVPQLARGEHHSAVEQSARHGRDRDPVAPGPVLAMQSPDAVDPDTAATRAAPSRNAHVDPRPPAPLQSPEL